ncbi:MAG: AmmeMemoRadiSam system radical SAM enzyme [candidate division Zixibacteria bacterium]|nr:AmmeMemoRadiSam system radical SAM enzyme [candidate division Zixibacteria bacterium]MDH3936350.1 AmmeMemoRadiSam system radical SAM enzyme [candidate division Zixibacteria bacterium]
MHKEAAFYQPLPNNQVQCELCPAECKLDEGKVGICGCRFNKQGKLFTDNYGQAVTLGVDPIEKKPLYHFYPGTDILSTGANGCNLGCLHCQNWSISQTKTQTEYVAPETLVEVAQRHDSTGVAFTYTEPMIWYEYIMDAAPLLHQADLKVVLVTNGYIMPQPLATLVEYIDAANVDLKGMRPEFYAKICKGKLEPVLQTIETLAASDVHLEVTNLLIPGKNDSDEDIAGLVDFVASLSVDIPLHLSAYHPQYKLNVNATPADTMLRARALAQEKLNHVFLGNIASDEGSDSTCAGCGHTLIRRLGYRTEVVGINGAVCAECGRATTIVR